MVKAKFSLAICKQFYGIRQQEQYVVRAQTLPVVCITDILIQRDLRWIGQDN